MACIKYKDFKNICRICLLSCDMKFSLDHVIHDIYYKLTDGISFETNELPQQICSKCSEKINEIHAFSFQCKVAYSILTKCLNEFKNVRIKEEQADTNVELQIKSEITIENHKIEFVKVEELTNEFNEEVCEDNLDQNVIEKNSDSSDSTNAKEVTNRLYKCDHCPKTFNKKRYLTCHKIIHSSKRPFKCEICSMTFIRSGSLKQHKRIHSGERPFECDICNKTFAQPSNLNTHKRSHSGERPFCCDICNKTFILMETLTKHKRIHSGERPYECEICNKTFSQLGNFNRHKRIHTGERPYECEICDKSFSESRSLNRHKLTHKNKTFSIV